MWLSGIECHGAGGLVSYYKVAMSVHCHKSVPVLIWPYMLLGRKITITTITTKAYSGNSTIRRKYHWKRFPPIYCIIVIFKEWFTCKMYLNGHWELKRRFDCIPMIGNLEHPTQSHNYWWHVGVFVKTRLLIRFTEFSECACTPPEGVPPIIRVSGLTSQIGQLHSDYINSDQGRYRLGTVCTQNAPLGVGDQASITFDRIPVNIRQCFC